MAGRIKRIDVEVPAGLAGRLERGSGFSFTYDLGISAAEVSESTDYQVSLTMPVRTSSYLRGALFPVFEMNLPEGFVRRYIAERMRKHAAVDEMLFLALAADRGIGRLSYRTEEFGQQIPEPASLSEVLSAQQNGYFADLVERYLLQTSAGVSGVQPKVVVPELRGTAVLPSLIVKAGGDEYPHLAANEMICMSIARQAGIKVPDFWISDDLRRFVMRRFDLVDGERLGVEDFSVLMARPGDRKYEGSYEAMFKAGRLFGLDLTVLFEQLVVSLLVGNGDAHLKNFAVIYSDPAQVPELSPLFDVVCTRYYRDATMALHMNGSRDYPERAAIESFGQKAGVRHPEQIIERMSSTVESVLDSDIAREHPGICKAIRAAAASLTTRKPLKSSSRR